MLGCLGNGVSLAMAGTPLSLFLKQTLTGSQQGVNRVAPMTFEARATLDFLALCKECALA